MSRVVPAISYVRFWISRLRNLILSCFFLSTHLLPGTFKNLVRLPSLAFAQVGRATALLKSKNIVLRACVRLTAWGLAMARKALVHQIRRARRALVLRIEVLSCAGQFNFKQIDSALVTAMLAASATSLWAPKV